MLKIMGKKYLQFYTEKFCLSKPMPLFCFSYTLRSLKISNQATRLYSSLQRIHFSPMKSSQKNSIFPHQLVCMVFILNQFQTCLLYPLMWNILEPSTLMIYQLMGRLIRDQARGRLGPNSRPRGRNFALNGTQGEVGVSLKKKKFFF